jgi:septal ring factor EnvC (AmiA/AmiB activator)
VRILITIILLSSVLFASKRPRSRAEIRKLITREKKTIFKINKQEVNLLKKIDGLQHSIFESNKEIVKIKFQLKEKNKELDYLKNILGSTNKTLENQSKLINELINKVMRLQGSNNTLFMESIFNSGNFNQLRENLKLSELFMNRYFELTRNLNKTNAQRVKDIKKITESAKELLALKEKEATTLGIQKNNKMKLLAFLKKIENKKTSHLKYLSELKVLEKNLNSKIASLKSKRHRFIGLRKRKGKLPYPIKGKIIQGYGRQVNKKFNTIHFNKGVVLASKRTSAIKAVHDGVVIYSGWFRGYGNLIIINHGKDYYSLYARASKIVKHKNDKIRKGEVIAISKRKKNGVSQIYFELRHRKKTLNPTKWFRR